VISTRSSGESFAAASFAPFGAPFWLVGSVTRATVFVLVMGWAPFESWKRKLPFVGGETVPQNRFIK